MKTKLILIFAGLFLIAGTLLYFSNENVKEARQEAARQQNNVGILNKNFKSYKNAYGNSVAKVEALNYTVSELKTTNSDLTKKLKQNGIKPSEVKSIADVGTGLKIDTIVEVIYKDSVKCFEYADKWNKVSGCFTKRDSASLKLESRDSLLIIPKIIPKKFLFIKYGVKGVELNVINSNPYACFSYLKYYEINKQ